MHDTRTAECGCVKTDAEVTTSCEQRAEWERDAHVTPQGPELGQLWTLIGAHDNW
jgi:hypothetical protein